eukprot:TRINITY_DN8286_c0_g1_i1.p1 TRINITY_DN8286_c0_g1~~TRINITY_DN8286_c0_g1_i1.p1  ORF type:complete len:489 (+),score=54.13 TRINITY_DN8286_c0_g1_i1:64-1530(+)
MRHYHTSIEPINSDASTPLLSSLTDSSLEDAHPKTDTVTAKRARLASIDLLRGIIVIIMAWDHVKDFTSKYSGHDDTTPDGKGGIFGDHSERWYGPLELWSGKPQYLFARFVSHFCAPGFAYLMGTGMVLLSLSRRKRNNWTSGHLLYFFTLRGTVLIALGFVVRAASAVELAYAPPHFKAFLTPPRGVHILVAFFQVMTSLGMQMIVLAYLLELLHFIENAFQLQKFRLRFSTSNPLLSFGFQPLILFLLGFGCMVCTTLTIHQAQHGDPGAIAPPTATTFVAVLHRFVLIPGPFIKDFMIMAYPLVPWLGLSLWGAAAGFEFKTNPHVAHQRALLNGILLLCAFPLIRFFGGKYINLRGLPVDEGHEHPWNAFWVVCKYPPGFPYICITLGADLVGLFLLSTVDASKLWARIVLHYGRSPLMFYVSHFYFISIVALALWGIGHVDGVPLPVCIVFYLLIVFVEFFIVRAFDRFKAGTDPNSLWRLL